MKTISKIAIWPLAKISTILGAIFGLLASAAGLIYIKYKIPEQITATGPLDFVNVMLTGIVIYAIIGFVVGLLYAYFYNLITKYTKGIQVELK
jgi:hypothetical protein|tara:strand:+ start:160 stop:438 length:279 start_codon:yes stop_codon:yes gene_type:complete